MGGDISVNNETLLVTNFVNLKIKSAQSFKYDYRGRVCVHMFIEVLLTCINIYVYTVFLKKMIKKHHRRPI
jgi:hypothetical protein